MIDVTVGAVGAALIAGLISLIGLIIGKEQKVSEFRQSWINDLRICLVSYLANINAIVDNLGVQSASGTKDTASLQPLYKTLNEASNGIKLRINPAERPAKKLLKSMLNFEQLASSNATFTPEKAQIEEQAFLKASQKLLKYEWGRVKRGEPIFIWTKWGTILITVIAFLLLAYLILTPRNNGEVFRKSMNMPTPVELLKPAVVK